MCGVAISLTNTPPSRLLYHLPVENLFDKRENVNKFKQADKAKEGVVEPALRNQGNYESRWYKVRPTAIFRIKIQRFAQFYAQITEF